MRTFRSYFLVLICFIVIIYGGIICADYFVDSDGKNDNTNKTLVDFDNPEIFGDVKSDFEKNIISNLDEEESGLALGYLLGNKTALSDGLLRKIKEVGLAHIVVVSGTHLAIIMSVVRKIFGKLSRLSGLYFTFGFLVLYIAIVGLSPSLLRAGTITIIGLFGWYFGRELVAWRKIVYLLAICILYNPLILLSLSFQLSVLSYVGILIILPRMNHFFYGKTKPSKVGSLLLATISASVVMIPIQLYYFGTFSFISFLSNIVILPTIAAAMGLSFLTGIFGMFQLNYFAMVFGKLANLVLKFQIDIINFLSDRPELMIEIDKQNSSVLLSYILLIFLVLILAYFDYKKRKEKLDKFKNLDKINIWD